MKEQETVNQPTTETSKKPGFLKRIIDKVDTAMKVKSDEKSQSSCCSEDSDGKGGKCC
ncbi:MAG: hypothetical protein JKY51_05095 [Opitutaceae bacterium]|nr:hypothetical protein [Opitutaceae bacterium]